MNAVHGRLVGVYRPRAGRPGFGIPVFYTESFEILMVQVADRDGRVARFHPCTANRDEVRWLDPANREEERLENGLVFRVGLAPADFDA